GKGFAEPLSRRPRLSVLAHLRYAAATSASGGLSGHARGPRADRRFGMSDLRDPDMASALVLLSGGQDSAVCLAWALARYGRVETVGFDYGQRHAVEMKARLQVREGM